MASVNDLRRAGGISHEFVAILDEHFPDKMPDGSETHDEIQRNIGSIKVVRTIKTWLHMLENPEDFSDEASVHGME